VSLDRWGGCFGWEEGGGARELTCAEAVAADSSLPIALRQMAKRPREKVSGEGATWGGCWPRGGKPSAEEVLPFSLCNY
jgi:hypothetical protein